MQYNIFNLLELLGALVVFLYGMKLMSESLQKVASDKMRSILGAMTSNKYMGILTGFTITAIIQSSSATTVMLVSFVNAGLVSLSQSIGVIMGANIGTTVTAWIISVFGFKMEISHYVLPLMAIALPLMFSSNKKRNSWGGVIIGFALIFIGLDFLKNATPDIHNNPEIISFLAKFSNWGYWSVIIYLLIGTILTMIMQSSSAVMALTLVMCFNGWISFEMAASMVLGQNIGTTITANLAALVANTTAKRTARAHLIFNVFGVFMALIIFYPFLNIIDSITVFFGGKSPIVEDSQTLKETAEAIPIALSVFHTIFNTLNTLLLIWFVPGLVKMVNILVPQKEDDEEFSLKYINTGILSTNELSILQAKKETIVYAEHINKMLLQVKNIISAQNDKKLYKNIDKIKKMEVISDQLEEEIANYLTHISEESLSISSSENINLIFFIISSLEDIADCCNTIGNTYSRKMEQKINLNNESKKNLLILLDLVNQQGLEATKNLTLLDKTNSDEYVKIKNKIVKLHNSLRNNHFKDLKKGLYKCKNGIIYSDLYSDLAKIGNYFFEINKAIYEYNKNGY